MSYIFFVSSNINFGRGALADLPEIVKRYDMKSLMIVYDGGVKAAGIADKVVTEVEKTGVSYCIFDGVIPNPTNEVVEEAAVIAKEKKVEGFVAVGGGSSIDLAKAVNVLMTNLGKIGEYGGMNMVKNPCLPLIAIPTTAGTSSEITNVSALIDTEKVIKYVRTDDAGMYHYRLQFLQCQSGSGPWDCPYPQCSLWSGARYGQRNGAAVRHAL